MTVKVAFLIERFDPHRGGMETSAAEFLTEMALLGPELHVITQAGVSDFSGARVRPVGVGGWGRSGRYRHFVQAAEKLLGQERWDVIHAVTPCLRCSLYQPRSGTAREALARTVALRRSWISRLARKTAATFNLKERLLSDLERGLLSGATPPMVAALSSYMRRQLIDSYHLDSNRVRDVFNGVTVALPTPADRATNRARLRAELGLSPDDAVAIFVGHNFRRKGLRRLIEAAARPGLETWDWLVVGKDNARPYESYARQLGLGQRMRFLGARSDVRQLYQAADAAVLPSYYDPCSRTVLEAMSLGIPCIATRFDGSSDCIRTGENGFVIESPDAVDELAGALRQLLHPGLRAKLGANALGLRPYLSMRRHAEEIMAIYESLPR